MCVGRHFISILLAFNGALLNYSSSFYKLMRNRKCWLSFFFFFFCFPLYLFRPWLCLSIKLFTNMLGNLWWITNGATMLETKIFLFTIRAVFFPPKTGFPFITWCINDRDCCCSTLVPVILQRFRVNMSLWVRRMIASAWSAWSVNLLAAITH